MADGSLDLEKQPMGSEPSVMAPPSGSYGEGQALQNLQAQLPPTAPVSPQQAGPSLPTISPQPPAAAPAGNEGRPPGPPAPPGVPSPILAPTSQPNTPVSTPLQSSQPAPLPMTAQQKRLQVLDVLANDPTVSNTTRSWATMVRRTIIGA